MLGTTCIILVPISFNVFIYFAGFPDPVVITGTFYSIIKSIISST